MRKPKYYVGRCIYCDSTEGLTREHIIPEGLGGRIKPDGHHQALVLRDASCASCQDVTRRIEETVLRKMLGHYREKKGMVRKDRRSDIHRVRFTMPDGEVIYEDVQIDQIPAAVVLPVFGEPGLFSGAPIGGPYQIRLFTYSEDGLPEPTMEPPPDAPKAMAVASVGPDVFAQMLAKIGLGLAVCFYGIDGFKPLVRNFILGNAGEFGHWVGGPINAEPEPPSDSLYEYHLAELHHEDSKVYIVAYLRVFANLGGPRNYVIVGEALPKYFLANPYGRIDRR